MLPTDRIDYTRKSFFKNYSTVFPPKGQAYSPPPAKRDFRADCPSGFDVRMNCRYDGDRYRRILSFPFGLRRNECGSKTGGGSRLGALCRKTLFFEGI